VAQIFLCHASEDKTPVREVYRRLRENGFQPWLDEEDLIGGQQWEQEIPVALQASDFILIFFSQNSIRKIGYVQNEFKLALEAWRQTPEGMIRTIPVRLDDSEVPRELAFPVKTRNFVRWSCPMLSMSRALSLTSASNGLMRCCLVRWQDERHSPTFRHR
jgi:hypothetical protein